MMCERAKQAFDNESGESREKRFLKSRKHASATRENESVEIRLEKPYRKKSLNIIVLFHKGHFTLVHVVINCVTKI